MTGSAGKDRILVWMRNFRMARRLCAAFERRGVGTVWAAALPEAIAAIDREFPIGVACTLVGTSPSLIDLETLVAYQVLGHAFASLPPLPFWALTDDPRGYAGQIEALELPVHLIPVEVGEAGLVEQMGGIFESGERERLDTGPEGEVLLLMESPEEGGYLARYLCSRGLPSVATEDPGEALAHLKSREGIVLVCEDFTLRRGGGSALWGWLDRAGGSVPIILVAAEAEWLAQVSPLALPRGVISILSKPIRTQALEASLRRLLRVTRAARDAGHPAPARALLH